MNEYKVELFIESDNDKDIEILNLKKQETQKWKKNMEARALSEYYKRKIKISSKK